MKDEPVFTLRAQDVSAPALVQLWITLNPQVSPEKKASAQKILEDMRKWQKKKAVD